MLRAFELDAHIYDENMIILWLFQCSRLLFFFFLLVHDTLSKSRSYCMHVIAREERINWTRQVRRLLCTIVDLMRTYTFWSFFPCLFKWCVGLVRLNDHTSRFILLFNKKDDTSFFFSLSLFCFVSIGFMWWACYENGRRRQ
jgi:hypothetical protein